MKIKIAPFKISHELESNKNKIINVLQSAAPEEWVVFPEGALTGYFPEENSFLENIRSEVVNKAINEIAKIVTSKQCYCVMGTARCDNDKWYNSAALFSPDGSIDFYDKIGLSELDKKHFVSGKDLKLFTKAGITFGIQICRELVLPDQWQELKSQGAQVVFHVNNAIKPYDAVWEHIVIARAVENQLFVISVNNCASPALLASYIAAPSGKLLLKTAHRQAQIMTKEVDMINYVSPY